MGEIGPRVVMRSCIQKVATGPELSKDLSFGEAHAAMACILDKKVDAVQAGVLGVSPSLPIRQNWPGGFHFCPQSQYEQYDKELSIGWSELAWPDRLCPRRVRFNNKVV